MSAISIALLALPFAASASVVCNPPDHPVYDDQNATITSCVSDAAWQKAANEQTAHAGQHLPVVQSGTVLVDEAGIKYQVPNITYYAGWVDLTHTDAYRANMRLIAQQLNGYPARPRPARHSLPFLRSQVLIL